MSDKTNNKEEGLDVCTWCQGNRHTLPLGMCRMHQHAHDLAEALYLVVNSGPLNNGLRDDNTMAIARAALAKAGVGGGG